MPLYMEHFDRKSLSKLWRFLAKHIHHTNPDPLPVSSVRVEVRLYECTHVCSYVYVSLHKKKNRKERTATEANTKNVRRDRIK